MSMLRLTVDEVTRKLMDDGQVPVFVEGDTNVNKVRFAIPAGFTDIAIDEDTVCRVMYMSPATGDIVTSADLTYVEQDGVHLYYDWDMAPEVFEKYGDMPIALCIYKDGGTAQGWHTVPYRIRIADSIHTALRDYA